MIRFPFATTALFVAAASLAARADEPPVSYTAEIKPFLAKYCVECHNQDDAEGGFVVEAYASLLAGGDGGPSLIAGKADESRLVLMLEGKAKPKMPPKTAARQPKAEEISRLRAWVAAGAKQDTGDATGSTALPAITPRAAAAPRITAAAFSPDSRILAVAAYNEVILLNPTDATVFAKFTPSNDADPISALAISSDGQWIAVATGSPSRRAEIHLYATPPPLRISDAVKPNTSFAAHADLIHAIAFSPDGKLLASAGYDRLVKLWNAATGAEVATLKDHSDSVYGITFSPDNKLLASAAADRAVKVWEVVSGRRLYTFGEPTDWVFATAWSPNGRYLAAAGADKSIRVWEAKVDGGNLVQSTFAHDGPITRLAYSNDSKTLFSLSDDGSVKAWDSERLVERQHFDKLPETPLSLALSGDGKQLAVGRFDGVLHLFDAVSGKATRDPLAVAAAKAAPKAEPPVIAAIRPRAAARGQTVRLTFDGKHLKQLDAVVLAGNPSKLAATIVADASRPAERAEVDLAIPADAVPGVLRIAVKAAAGASSELPFAILPFQETAEAAANESAASAQTVPIPTTIRGSIDRAGDSDYFRFHAKSGQELGIEVVAGSVGSKLEPVLTLSDESGAVLTESVGPLLGHKLDRDGTYTLRVRDVDYRGSAEMYYFASIGPLPIVTDIFPLGVSRGTEIDIEVRGVNLGGVERVQAKAADTAEPGTRIPVTIPLANSAPYAAPLNAKSLSVGEWPEVAEVNGSEGPGTAQHVAAPVTINGRIDRPDDSDFYRFGAKKGHRLILDVQARQIGSPLDSFVEVCDLDGHPLARATLRCLAKTYTVFRDHDSANPGIRIEDWRELAVNDHILINNELVRMQALPKNPDDDARFFEIRGQRAGYLDTTPAHVPLGTPIYKVSVHPPGTRFPPNGMPVFSIPFRNDDGGPQYGKDSRLFFDPPADGDYLVRIGDVRGDGSRSHAYRLHVRPAKPRFSVTMNPTSPKVWKGGAIPIAVSCERFDGFDGSIELEITNLPAGFLAPATTIPAGENATSLALFAHADAATPANDHPKMKLVARGAIHGETMTREVAGDVPAIVEPGDIVTTVDQSEVTITPGREARFTVQIERRNDFKGRVPIEVRGLPHGTRVLDIGLNGILITERETSRVVTLYSEPWAEPTTHPFVVLTKREGKNTEHAAKSVLLRLMPDVPIASPSTATGSGESR